ncbi:hypothetical protein Hanom_Chr10g00882381 [Helianthus anomalus]
MSVVNPALVKEISSLTRNGTTIYRVTKGGTKRYIKMKFLVMI